MREDPLARRSVAALIDLLGCIVLFWVVFRLFSREVRRGEVTVRVVSNSWLSGFAFFVISRLQAR